MAGTVEQKLNELGITLHALMQWLQRRILFWVDHRQIASV